MRTYAKISIIIIVLVLATNIQAQWKLDSTWPRGSCNTVIADSQYVYIGSGGMVSIWDRTDINNPLQVSEIATPDAVIDLVVSDSMLYVANRYGGFTIIDVHDPANPFICARQRELPYARNLFVRDSLTYIASPDGLWIYNVKDPSNPFVQGAVLNIGMGDVFVEGDYAYITEFGLSVIDISNPSEPAKIAHCGSDTMYCTDIYVHEGYAYVTEDYKGLQVFNIQDPENPVYVGNLFNGGWVWDVWGKDDLIFLPIDAPDGINLRILDISNPENIINVGELADVPTDWEQLYVHDDFAFWTSTYSGVKVIDISDPADPIKINTIPTSGPCYDVMVQDSLVYVVNNDLYILDLHDPENPVELGSYRTPFYEDGSAVYALGNNAYMSGHEGLRIIDVSDKSDPTELSSILNRKGDLPGGGLSASRQYVYWLSKDAGFVIVDITQPQNPSVINEFGGGRNSYVYDNYVFCAFGGNETEAYRALEIFDISDPYNPVQVSKLDMPELVEDNIALLVQENRAYIGSKDSVTILDVSDLENPSRINSFKVHYVFEISVSDNIIYTASYHGGVFMYDISDPQNPICIDTLGYDSFDCYNVLVVDNMMYVCDYNFGLYIFEQPGGPSKLCKNKKHTKYSTIGSINAQSYIWSIIPEEAGEISGSDTTAIVDWLNTFTGIAYITVRGINDIQEDVFFDTINVEVIDYPTSEFTFEKNDFEVAFTNMSTNASSFLWDFGDGEFDTAENPTHTFSNPDTYNVTLNAYSDYCGEDNSIQTIDIITDLDINELNNLLRIYPNPTSGSFYLEIENLNIKTVDISIVSIGGQIVYSGEIEVNHSLKIDLNEVNKGIYFIKIISNKYTKIEKLIIN